LLSGPGTNSRYRILALDVDGTLLDRDGRLRPRTSRAVTLAAEAGIRPVLCTGRRYRRALPIAEALGLDAPLVCNSGALVKSSRGHETLWRADLDLDLVSALLALCSERDELAISFIDRRPDEADFVVARDPTGRPLPDDYLSQNRPHALVDPSWADDPGRSGPHYHICTIGDHHAMQAVREAVEARFAGRVTTFVQRSPRYRGTMCEVLRHDASKWSALVHLADLWGVSASEIVAVGDDMNDVPMIAGAGLGVAMGHAPAEVLEVADLVTLDEENDGLARLIEDVLLA
jgi:Cof subfamily protein (haloacid dehalogenase superfamily)